MLKKRLYLVGILFILLACTPQPTPSSTPPPISAQPAGVSLITHAGDFFSAAGNCAVCHTALTDQTGADVSIDTFWRSTMMANAARDPYWQATVKAETLKTPAMQAAIEDKCATCHMPMAHFTAKTQSQPGTISPPGFLTPDHPLHPLAMDGVSCSLCHQIEPGNFAASAGFSGNYSIDTTRPAGDRLAYGPFPTQPQPATVMKAASGFVPTQSPHLAQSEVCATCHTLYTPSVDAAGNIVGQFPEQTPYLEWQAGDYSNTPCRQCHMPPAQGPVHIASVGGGPPQSPFSQHSFVGGNVYMMTVLKTFGDEMEVTANSQHFEATMARTVDQLQNRTAVIRLQNTSLTADTLMATIAVENKTGHKFPTGFPSRRAWIHVVVQDAAGTVVFESGAYTPNGAITGNANDDDPAAFEPHYTTITTPDQVQIYEAIMLTTDADVTTTLMRAAGYLKDNRLLPAGFNKALAPADIAVYGNAATDTDFSGGSDQIEYQINIAAAKPPFTISAQLLYQPIAYRWTENLRLYVAPETDRFARYYEAVPNTPVVIATAHQFVATQPPTLTPAPLPTFTPTPVTRPLTPTGSLTLGLIGLPASLNPLTDLYPVLTRLTPLLYQTLNRRDPVSARPLPGAASLPVISANGLTLTYTLAITAPPASLVQASLQAAVWPQLASVQQITIVDTRTILVTLAKPDCTLVDVLTDLPILSPTTVITAIPGATGPFMVESWQPQKSRLNLIPNPVYNGSPPGVANLTVLFFADELLAWQALKHGEVDVLPLSALPEAVPGGYHSLTYPGAAMTFVAFNTTRPPFNEVRIRTALSAVLNRDWLAAQLVNGTVKPQTGLLPADHYAALPVAATDDPATAESLLDEAGFTTSNNRRNDPATGKPWKLNIRADAGNPQESALALLIADSYRQLGIDVHANLVTVATLMDDLLTHDYQLAVYSLPVSARLNWRAYWHSDQVAAELGVNLAAYANPQVDAWLEEADQVAGCSLDRRAGLYRQIQAQLAKDRPVTILSQPLWQVVVKDGLQGVVPGTFTPVTWNVEEWWIK